MEEQLEKDMQELEDAGFVHLSIRIKNVIKELKETKEELSRLRKIYRPAIYPLPDLGVSKTFINTPEVKERGFSC